jgi:hypothetical protein
MNNIFTFLICFTTIFLLSSHGQYNWSDIFLGYCYENTTSHEHSGQCFLYTVCICVDLSFCDYEGTPHKPRFGFWAYCTTGELSQTYTACNVDDYINTNYDCIDPPQQEKLLRHNNGHKIKLGV